MSIFDPSIAVTSCKLISSFPERPAHFFGEAFVTVPIARAPTGMTTYPLITTSFATVNRMRWPSIARAELIVSASLRSTSVPSGTRETPLVTGVGATVGVMIVAGAGGIAVAGAAGGGAIEAAGGVAAGGASVGIDS